MIRNLRVSPNGATAEVASHTIEGKWYNVVKSGTGEYRCTCPRSFIKREECKHIDEVMTAIYLAEFTAPEKPSLFIVHFSVGRTRHQAVVTAVDNYEAKSKVLRTYVGAGARDIVVIATNRQVIIR